MRSGLFMDGALIYMPPGTPTAPATPTAIRDDQPRRTPVLSIERERYKDLLVLEPQGASALVNTLRRVVPYMESTLRLLGPTVHQRDEELAARIERYLRDPYLGWDPTTNYIPAERGGAGWTALLRIAGEVDVTAPVSDGWDPTPSWLFVIPTVDLATANFSRALLMNP